MSKRIVEITGFTELSRLIQKLPDKVKRRELLKIYGQVANPTLKAARSFAPVGTIKHTRDNAEPGNLKKSIKKRIGRKGNERVNAVLYVGPSLKGKNKGWYAHMVHDGTVRGIKPNPFMRKALAITRSRVTIDAEKRVVKYIQKQINRLSNAQ